MSYDNASVSFRTIELDRGMLAIKPGLLERAVVVDTPASPKDVDNPDMVEMVVVSSTWIVSNLLNFL
jgi:hypothetical protein